MTTTAAASLAEHLPVVSGAEHLPVVSGADDADYAADCDLSPAVVRSPALQAVYEYVAAATAPQLGRDLRDAVLAQRTALVRWLVRRCEDGYVYGTLRMAAREGLTDFVLLLLTRLLTTTKGAAAEPSVDPVVAGATADHTGWSLALRTAARAGRLSTVTALLAWCQPTYGRSRVVAAVSGALVSASHRAPVVLPPLLAALLVEERDPTMTTAVLQDSLCSAIQNGHQATAVALLDGSHALVKALPASFYVTGVLPAVVAYNHQWALRHAARHGQLEVVRALLVAGSQVYAHQNEALRWAARNGHVAVVDELLAAGAYEGARNYEALRWAAVYGQRSVLVRLRASDRTPKVAAGWAQAATLRQVRHTLTQIPMPTHLQTLCTSLMATLELFEPSFEQQQVLKLAAATTSVKPPPAATSTTLASWGSWLSSALSGSLLSDAPEALVTVVIMWLTAEWVVGIYWPAVVVFCMALWPRFVPPLLVGALLLVLVVFSNYPRDEREKPSRTARAGPSSVPPPTHDALRAAADRGV